MGRVGSDGMTAYRAKSSALLQITQKTKESSIFYMRFITSLKSC